MYEREKERERESERESERERMAVCQDDLTEEERRIISRVLQRAEQMEAQEQDRIG